MLEHEILKVTIDNHCMQPTACHPRQNKYGGEEEFWVSVRETGSREQEEYEEKKRIHRGEDSSFDSIYCLIIEATLPDFSRKKGLQSLA